MEASSRCQLFFVRLILRSNFANSFSPCSQFPVTVLGSSLQPLSEICRKRSSYRCSFHSQLGLYEQFLNISIFRNVAVQPSHVTRYDSFYSERDSIDWMFVQKLTRVEQIITPFIRHRLFVPPSSRPYSPLISRAMAMAHLVASSSHPAQLPALNSPHAHNRPTAKEKKPKAVDGSAYPLEVRFVQYDML